MHIVECVSALSCTQSRSRTKEHDTLMYSVSKTKVRLIDCGLLNNGGPNTNDDFCQGVKTLYI